MKQYEITFITIEDLKEALVKEAIEKFDGKILKTENLGEKQFAYPIKKERKGFYTTFIFEFPSDKLIELNKKLTLEDEILRYLIITSKKDLNAVPEAPKVETELAVEKVALTEPAETELAVEAINQEVLPAETEKEAEKTVKKTVKEKAVKEKVKAIKVEEKIDTEVEEIKTEEETEEDRLKALDKKLDELLKE